MLHNSEMSDYYFGVSDALSLTGASTPLENQSSIKIYKFGDLYDCCEEQVKSLTKSCHHLTLKMTKVRSSSCSESFVHSFTAERIRCSNSAAESSLLSIST